jgi:hypothetical protein
MINIVNEEFADLNLQVLFTYENKEASDTTWGYFWNNGLDSIMLHSQNFEDYFIFGNFSRS